MIVSQRGLTYRGTTRTTRNLLAVDLRYILMDILPSLLHLCVWFAVTMTSMGAGVSYVLKSPWARYKSPTVRIQEPTVHVEKEA